MGTNRNLYFAIENLALTNAQRATLVAALQGLGALNGGLPNERNHWRIRQDNDAAIFHATFDDANIGLTAIKSYIADVFGVSPSSINHTAQTVNFTGGAHPTRVLTLSRTGTDYLRMAILGYTPGNWPTWAESRAEVLAYMAAHDATAPDNEKWDPPEV